MGSQSVRGTTQGICILFFFWFLKFFGGCACGMRPLIKSFICRDVRVIVIIKKRIHFMELFSHDLTVAEDTPNSFMINVIAAHVKVSRFLQTSMNYS